MKNNSCFFQPATVKRPFRDTMKKPNKIREAKLNKMRSRKNNIRKQKVKLKRAEEAANPTTAEQIYI